MDEHMKAVLAGALDFIANRKAQAKDRLAYKSDRRDAAWQLATSEHLVTVLNAARELLAKK